MFGNKAQQKNNADLKLMRIINHLDKFSKAGLLFMDEEQSRVVISSNLAILFISKKETFSNFMKNVALWMSFERSVNIMKKFTKEELNNMECPPIPPEKQIDFCIVTAKGEPIVVGNYKEKHLNMVAYDEVKEQL